MTKILIEALLHAPNKKLRLEGILAYVCQKYPNLTVNQKKLENGVRCNLSIHKLFRRLGQPRTKNSYWEMDTVEYRKMLDEEKQKEEEGKSYIDQRAQVALNQWNNLKSKQHQDQVRVDFRQTQELRNAESFLVSDESGIKNRGQNKIYRPYGIRNLNELADRINEKAIENIKS